MTNNHVLQSAAEAADAAVQFRYEHDMAARAPAGGVPARAGAALRDRRQTSISRWSRWRPAVPTARRSRTSATCRSWASRARSASGSRSTSSSTRKASASRWSSAKARSATCRRTIARWPTIPATPSPAPPARRCSATPGRSWRCTTPGVPGHQRRRATGSTSTARNGTRPPTPTCARVKWVANEGIRVSSLVARIREMQADPATARRATCWQRVLAVGEAASRDGVFPRRCRPRPDRGAGRRGVAPAGGAARRGVRHGCRSRFR